MINKTICPALIAAIAIAGCDAPDARDADPVAAEVLASAEVDDVQAPIDPFALAAVVDASDDEVDRLIAYDEHGNEIGSVTITVGAGVLTAAFEFVDGSRLLEIDVATGGTQIYSQGISDAEFDRRLGLLKLKAAEIPQAGGVSCGLRFAAWAYACATTLIGCAIVAWPAACECAQWIEKKFGDGAGVYEGGACEDL